MFTVMLFVLAESDTDPLEGNFPDSHLILQSGNEDFFVRRSSLFKKRLMESSMTSGLFAYFGTSFTVYMFDILEIS